MTTGGVAGYMYIYMQKNTSKGQSYNYQNYHIKSHTWKKEDIYCIHHGRGYNGFFLKATQYCIIVPKGYCRQWLSCLTSKLPVKPLVKLQFFIQQNCCTQVPQINCLWNKCLVNKLAPLSQVSTLLSSVAVKWVSCTVQCYTEYANFFLSEHCLHLLHPLRCASGRPP